MLSLSSRCALHRAMSDWRAGIPKTSRAGTRRIARDPLLPHPPQPRLAWQRHFDRDTSISPASMFVILPLGPQRSAFPRCSGMPASEAPRKAEEKGRVLVLPRLDSKKGTISAEDKGYLTEILHHRAPSGWIRIDPSLPDQTQEEAESQLQSPPSGFPSTRCASGGTIHLAGPQSPGQPPGSP